MPDNDTPVSRRRVLQASALSAAAGAAGCLNSITGGGGSTPTPDPPSIEQQTIKKEKAGITHLLSIVSGTAVWPSFSVQSAGGGGSSIVGIWETQGQRWQFAADNSFTIQTSEGSLSGQYAVEGSTVTIQVQTEEGTRQFNYQYSISGSGSNRQLTLSGEGETVRLQYAGGGGGGGGPSDPVEAVKQLTLVPEQGASATREQQELQTGASGSGFVVSPDGYIVTNAHVVLAGRDRKKLLWQKLAGTTKRAVVREMESRYQISESKREQIAQIMSSKLINYFVEQGTIQGVATDYNVLNGVAKPGEDVKVKSWSATVEKQGTVTKTVNGQPSWGRDVAIIKVNQSNLPTVQLGSSENLTAGDKVFVIGYPNIQIESYFKGRSSALQPTLTSGVVSQMRTLNSGVETIQTDAAINHGNSGGPMFDENGDVVGIATFGPSDVGIEQVGFGLVIEVAKQFMNQLNVQNTQGELDEAYEAALDAYWRCDCPTVERKIDSVTNLYPGHPYANEWVRKCETGDTPCQEETES